MRTNKISILIGNRNTGKTIYAKSIMKAALESGKSVLVIDTYDHPAYSAVQRIRPDQIGACSPGKIYRCFGSETDMILNGCNAFYNGLLVLEDATKYIEQRLNEETKRFFYDCKQKNVDILAMFHSWVACPPVLFRIADNVLIKKTGDNCLVRKNDCPNFAEVQAAFNEVEQSDNRYIVKYVKLQ